MSLLTIKGSSFTHVVRIQSITFKSPVWSPLFWSMERWQKDSNIVLIFVDPCASLRASVIIWLHWLAFIHFKDKSVQWVMNKTNLHSFVSWQTEFKKMILCALLEIGSDSHLQQRIAFQWVAFKYANALCQKHFQVKTNYFPWKVCFWANICMW